MRFASLEKIEHSLKVIEEMVEQGECFYIREKFKELEAEIKFFHIMALTKFLDESEVSQ